MKLKLSFSCGSELPQELVPITSPAELTVGPPDIPLPIVAETSVRAIPESSTCRDETVPVLYDGCGTSAPAAFGCTAPGKPTLITDALIRQTFNEANADPDCAGVITWMHTFSPAKNWIRGTVLLQKPLLHLATQYLDRIPYDTIEEAVAGVNNSRYGLQAGVFTSSLAIAHYAAEHIEAGGVVINDGSSFRMDNMPYGGVKDSGMGKEGPEYAIRELTEEKTIIMNFD